MLELLKEKSNKTDTENGAVTYKGTKSYCLDLFSTIGALRSADETEIVKRFIRAYNENPDMAMKILFYARDVRGGIGERRVFRIILKFLALYNKQSLIKNIKYVGEYGRFDDLLVLLYTDCKEYVIKFIKEQLEQDIDLMAEGKNISLLAKWLPSVNASNKATKYNARKIAKALEMDNCEYRKMLSRLRNYIKIIENNLREKDYTFDYSYQPSKALMKYRKAFIRNDKDRYSEFLQDVQSGNAKINTETLTPYDIIAPIINEDTVISDEERKSLDITWDNQADYTNDENAVVVADTSGSMYWCSATPKPISVAFSLAIYFAERKYCETFAECANTDIQAVFDLVLSTAVKNKTLPEDMPSKLYIISDMEFDYCAENSDVTNFEYAKEKFEQNGYALPKVVFWNVASRNMQSPVEMNEQGVTLVSGCNPRIFSMVTEDKCTPYEYMLDVLNQERYADIKA